MQTLGRYLKHLIEALMALCMAGMVVVPRVQPAKP